MIQVQDRGRFVYFAHEDDGARVKVGVSGDPAGRCKMARWTLIGAVPGSTAYEAATHWALRAYNVEGEWFRSCAPVWRFALETVAAGALNWLPPLPARYPREVGTNEDAIQRFGSYRAAARAIGLAPTAFARTYGTPFVAWGRLYAEIARLDGRLPSYIAAPGEVPVHLSRKERWTPEMRAAHSVALKDAWAARRVREARRLAPPPQHGRAA